jgi:hypothetical protein
VAAPTVPQCPGDQAQRQNEARLAQMHEQGAEFVADNLVTKAVVAEIVG